MVEKAQFWSDYLIHRSLSITGNLKMEAPLRIIMFVCKVACPGLASGSREQLLQSYDGTQSL